MGHLHACVNDGDDHARAIEPAAPGQVGTDQGHALLECWGVEGVLDDASDEQARSFQLGEGVGTDLERHQRNRRVGADHLMSSSCQSGQDLASHARDVAPLNAESGSREKTFRNMPAGGESHLCNHSDSTPRGARAPALRARRCCWPSQSKEATSRRAR